jgi:hypothetical protein
VRVKTPCASNRSPVIEMAELDDSAMKFSPRYGHFETYIASSYGFAAVAGTLSRSWPAFFLRIHSNPVVANSSPDLGFMVIENERARSLHGHMAIHAMGRDLRSKFRVQPTFLWLVARHAPIGGTRGRLLGSVWFVAERARHCR